MKPKTMLVVFTSLVLGVLFNWFFFAQLPGISVFLYTSLILSCTVVLAWQFKKPLPLSVYGLMSLALFFSAMVAVRANPFLVFVNICLVLYLLLMIVHLSYQPSLSLRQHQISQYISLAGGTALRIVGEFFWVLLRPLSMRTTPKSKTSYVPIIRGLLLSLPILFVFLLLLSSADLVFQKYLDGLFDFSVTPETVFRWVLVGFVTSLFTGAYALIFMPATKPDVQTESTKKKLALGTTESSIILGSVSVLFLMFVIVQLAYLFGGSSHVLAAGFTYAEYARKGFFELIAVAAISLVLILNIKKATKLQTVSETMIFRWLSSVLVAEVLVIMLSAHRRLNLYEDAYGFTTLRLWSHVFVLWLAVAFVLLAMHIISEKSEKLFAFQLFVSVMCFFVCMNIINPDAFIARQNINRFNAVNKLDADYLGTLSADAVPATALLLNHSDQSVQRTAAGILLQQKLSAEDDSKSWQASNLGRSRAERVFRNHAE